MPLMLANVAFLHGRFAQVVLVGDPEGPEMAALEQALANVYLPWSVTIPIRSDADQQALAGRWPWLSAMKPDAGKAAAYVCYDFTCQAPVTSPADLEQHLREAAAPRVVLG